MIRGYTDFAANERTFLAWVRTAIAVIALGFVIERFNLFLLVMVPQLEATGGASRLHHLANPTSGQYGGMALVGTGVILIIVAMVRFLQTVRLLSENAAHVPRETSTTLFLLSALVLSVAAFSVYLAIG
jgi:putative membrane protein